jgi:hypothetical protein
MTSGQIALLTFGIASIAVYIWYEFFDLGERIKNSGFLSLIL